MKHWLLFILVISWFCFPLSGQQTNRPDWVKQHPVSGLNYIGIGMAEISGGDYQQKAKQNALSDLVSEIQVVIAANSLLNTLEDDGNVKQTFAESIRTEARAEIENFRLVDSWRSDNEYWVYYELNKDDYAALVEARRQKAIRNGFDFWYKGHITLQQGDLMTAIELFSNGMEAIRPVLNQELFCSYEGKTINLATELYAALAGVFDGITIVLNPATVSVTPFQGIREPIAIGVYRNGNPLRNIRLKAEFVSGSGDLSSMSPTDESGVAALYVRNITSKQAQQEIIIECAKTLGANRLEIILYFILPEARPAIILAITNSMIGLINASSMAGTVGGGGIGDLAISQGYQRFNSGMIVVTVVILIINLSNLILTVG